MAKRSPLGLIINDTPARIDWPTKGSVFTTCPLHSLRLVPSTRGALQGRNLRGTIKGIHIFFNNDIERKGERGGRE